MVLSLLSLELNRSATSRSRGASLYDACAETVFEGMEGSAGLRIPIDIGGGRSPSVRANLELFRKATGGGSNSSSDSDSIV